MDSRRRLEKETHNYWIVSSVWNGRIDLGGGIGSGAFMKKVQQLMSAASSFRLLKVYAHLLDEVIQLGNKQNVKFHVEDPPEATIHQLHKLRKEDVVPCPDAIVEDADGQLWMIDYKTAQQ